MTQTQQPTAKPNPEAAIQKLLKQAVDGGLAFLRKIDPDAAADLDQVRRRDVTRPSDVVVGDYNYYFDMTALLYGLTVLNGWRVTLLVDEAHNLIERARGMYSAELDQFEFNALRKIAPTALKGVLERVGRHWNQLHADQQVPYQIYPLVPDLFIATLQKAVSAITDHLTDQPTGNDAGLLRFYLDAMLFCRRSFS